MLPFAIFGGDGPQSQASRQGPPGVDDTVELAPKQCRVLPGFSFAVEIIEVLWYDPSCGGLIHKWKYQK